MEGARTATPDDVSVIADLAKQLHDELAARRGGRWWTVTLAPDAPLADHYARVAVDGGDDADEVLVAGTIDDVVVGFGAAHVEVLRDATRLAVIDAVFVEEPARGVGVGEAIVDALCAWAKQRAAGGVDAYALPGDRAAKNFFEAHGFTARLLTMHRAP